MQDLIKEDEFVTPVNYNPWKSFITFYIIASLINVVSSVVLKYTYKNYNLSIFILSLSGIAPIVICLAMFLHKKEKLALPWHTKFRAIFILFIVYITSSTATTIFNYSNKLKSLEQYVQNIAVLTAFYTILIGIATLIVYIAQTIKLKRGQL